jgi:GT2 family glycosyltransferase
MMLLSIIILNYDTRDLLKDCLHSIPESSQDFPLEILIINNGSPTDTAESLSGLHPQAVVYDLPVNVGFGQANNLGVQKARGEYVLLLNSDTYFQENSLERFQAYVPNRMSTFLAARSSILMAPRNLSTTTAT